MIVKKKINADLYTVEYTKRSWLLRLPREREAYCYDNPQRVLPGYFVNNFSSIYIEVS